MDPEDLEAQIREQDAGEELFYIHLRIYTVEQGSSLHRNKELELKMFLLEI